MAKTVQIFFYHLCQSLPVRREKKILSKFSKGAYEFPLVFGFQGQMITALPATLHPNQLILVVFGFLILPTQRHRAACHSICCLCSALIVSP